MKQGEPKPHSFCETPEEKCTMNYCDTNGCQNRKRELVELQEQFKQETLVESAEKHFRSCWKSFNEIDYLNFGAKWQQEQDKKMYSEEIFNILDNVRYWETCPDEYKIIIEKFIDKFKNK